MPEVLGKNMKEFFDKVDPSYKDAEITKKYIEKPTHLGVGWIAQNKKRM